MFWDFGSVVSSQRQAAGDHVQKSASVDPQQSQDPQQQQQRASGNCSTLPRIATHCPNRLRKAQKRRTHTRSSAETTSESAPNVSAVRNSRQIFTEHHGVRRWHLLGLARQCHGVHRHRRAPRDHDEGPECGLKQDFVSATVSITVSLGAKSAQTEGEC